MKRKLAISLADKLISLVEDSLKNPDSKFNTHLDLAVKKLDDNHNAYCKLCHMVALSSLMSAKETNGLIEVTSEPIFIDVFDIPRASNAELFEQAVLDTLNYNMSDLVNHAMQDVKDIYNVDASAKYEVCCYKVHKLQDPQPVWHIEIKAKVKLS